MSEPSTQLETVNLTIARRRRDDRAQPPRQRSTPGTRQFGDDLLARAARAAAEDDAVRAVAASPAPGRGFSSGADLKDLGGGATRRGAPGRLHDADRASTTRS